MISRRILFWIWWMVISPKEIFRQNWDDNVTMWLVWRSLNNVGEYMSCIVTAINEETDEAMLKLKNCPSTEEIFKDQELEKQARKETFARSIIDTILLKKWVVAYKTMWEEMMKM